MSNLERVKILIKRLNVSVFDEPPSNQANTYYYALLETLLFSKGLFFLLDKKPKFVLNDPTMRSRLFSEARSIEELDYVLSEAGNDDEFLLVAKRLIDQSFFDKAENVIASIKSKTKKCEAFGYCRWRTPLTSIESIENGDKFSKLQNEIMDGILSKAQETNFLKDWFLYTEARARTIINLNPDNPMNVHVVGEYNARWNTNTKQILYFIDIYLKYSLLHSVALDPSNLNLLLLTKDEISFFMNNNKSKILETGMEDYEFYPALSNLIIAHLKSSIQMDSFDGEGSQYFDHSMDSLFDWLMFLVLCRMEQVELMIENVDIKVPLEEILDSFDGHLEIVNRVYHWFEAWELKYWGTADPRTIKFMSLRGLQYEVDTDKAIETASGLYGTDRIKGYALIADKLFKQGSSQGNSQGNSVIYRALIESSPFTSYEPLMSWFLARVRILFLVSNSNQSLVESEVLGLRVILNQLEGCDKLHAALELALFEQELGTIDASQIQALMSEVLDKLPTVSHLHVVTRLYPILLMIDNDVAAQVIETIKGISEGNIPIKYLPELEAKCSDSVVVFDCIRILEAGDFPGSQVEAESIRKRLSEIKRNALPNKYRGHWLHSAVAKNLILVEKQTLKTYFGFERLCQEFFGDTVLWHSDEFYGAYIKVIKDKSVTSAFELTEKMPHSFESSLFAYVLIASLSLHDCEGLVEVFPAIPRNRPWSM